jgi:hypothetical protein
MYESLNWMVPWLVYFNDDNYGLFGISMEESLNLLLKPSGPIVAFSDSSKKDL